MTQEENEKQNMIRVVVCRPGERAEVTEIEDNLRSMQAVVGGLIQEYFPFHSEDDPRYDDLALIVNDEGKLMRMPPSRAVFDEDGHVQDVIAGPFFICYAPVESETFLSLPDDLAEEMRRKFDKPEMFYLLWTKWATQGEKGRRIEITSTAEASTNAPRQPWWASPQTPD